MQPWKWRGDARQIFLNLLIVYQNFLRIYLPISMYIGAWYSVWHVSNLSPIMVSGWQYAISWKLSAAISNFVSSIPTSLIYNPVFCSNASSLLFPPWSESQRGHGQVSLLPVWRRLTLYAVISLFLFFFYKKNPCMK